MKQISIAFALIATTMLSCCGSSESKEAEQLLNEAKAQIESKEYTKALATIDSLRHKYPKNIEARKAALKLHQDASLAQAQAEVAEADQRLQEVNDEYERIKAEAEKAKAELKATPEQLQAVTLKRIERDSLQTCYEVACAKIKYIHKRQQE